MIENLRKSLFHSAPFMELHHRLGGLSPGFPLQISGAAGSIPAFVAARVFDEGAAQVLLIGSDEDAAAKLRDDCALLAGDASVRFFGSMPLHQAQQLDVSSSIAQVETLRSLAKGEKVIVIASPNSIAGKIPPPGKFLKKIVECNTGSDVIFTNLLEQLQAMGFERKDFVESYGDMAVRGGILDVFPFIGEHPVRIEFWGNRIESIREFDVLSQRSIRELKTASIVASYAPDAGQADSGDDDVSGRDPDLTSSLFEYLAKESVVVLDSPEIIEKEIAELFEEGAEDLFPFTEIRDLAGKFRNVHTRLSDVLGSADQDTLLRFDSVPQPSFNGSIARCVDTAAKLAGEGYRIILASDTREEAARLRDLVGETLAPAEKGDGGFVSPETARDPVSATPTPGPGPEVLLHTDFSSETLHSGFIYRPAKIAVFTEHEIFGRLRRRGLARRRRFRGISQKELQQLKRGDYVVHIDKGIGTFAGLTTLNIGGSGQEVMKLLFEGGDLLYVNLNYVNRVQKYSSQDGHVPKLSRLGSAEWERTKERAKKKIRDIARDLIAIYARRKSEEGTAFSPDTHWQKELEASFQYEDTPDQATATIDVKQDMESRSPMDRLICGDVGFGKTEVAVRAAFKAVMDGKQVAVLVPTTILALQHYQTFLDRLSRYTTRVENLTRFRSKNEQETLVAALRRGTIDIIIGTHRLLSKDIGFRDLGLLIIDEEHRFGVSAKEKLRALKATVDTLSLTATPIPRTLHFSLIGARDLSIINTPPRNRMPIITEIIAGAEGRKSQWHIMREAIIRELHRGGQVYVVHDRVNNIDTVADQVRSHVPEARVKIAHGQMPGHQLERTMLEFLEKKFDVLVATKIIESGLDIPSVNTIIINRADRFGLAELYQLRGRVGRSNIQAYAYLLVPPLSLLPKQSLRRLQAIEEFTELGSGFNLAMRDLEIRGAGNLLGAEQSGFILEMGFEMYERIVRETVEELKQDEFAGLVPAGTTGMRPPKDAMVDVDVDALIPSVYVEADTERLDLYRRLYRIESPEELTTIRAELADRFGEYPVEVDNLLTAIELKMLAIRGGYPHITLKGLTLTVTLPDASDLLFYSTPEESGAPFQKMLAYLSREKRNYLRLIQTGKQLFLKISLAESGSPLGRLSGAKSRLEEVLFI